MVRRSIPSVLLAAALVLAHAPAAPSAPAPGLLQAESLRGGAAPAPHARTLAPGRAARGTWRTGALGSVAVRVRAPRCAVGPTLALAIDGRVALRAAVRGPRWRVLRGPVTIRAGRHRVMLGLRAGRARCARRADVDWVRATAPRAAAPSPGGGVAGAAPGPAPATVPPAEPLAARRLYAEPDSPARRQAAAWRATRSADAATMERLAAQPQAVWLGDWSGDVSRAAAGITAAAAAADALPVLVAYDIPQRDCGGWSAGGTTPEGYRAWIRQLAAGIADRPALVVLEPDALAGLDCLGPADRATRLALLHDAVDVLAGRPRVRVYIDAGNAGWHPAADIAARLRDAGIDRAAGFALNVSNFGADATEVAYGQAISGAVGGRPFVIDTSRNGLGPLAGQWCNPSGRAVGRRPELAPAVAGVDGFLWIKRPGESDGVCNGGPAAGSWWPDEALALARRAGW